MQPYYLVVDLEATCSDRSTPPKFKEHTVPRHEMETIEIGAVLCHPRTLAPVAEFQTFIQPVRHPVLTRFCTDLTSITQADVLPAPRFPAAIAALSAFLNGRDAIFGSWGDYDWFQLIQDARYHRCELPAFSDRLNLKAQFGSRQGGRPMGMAAALRRARLPLEGTHHRGIDDARNIARLLPLIVGEAAPAPDVPVRELLRQSRR